MEFFLTTQLPHIEFFLTTQRPQMEFFLTSYFNWWVWNDAEEMLQILLRFWEEHVFDFLNFFMIWRNTLFWYFVSQEY